MPSEFDDLITRFDERLRALEPCRAPQRDGTVLPAPHDFEGDGRCAVCKVPRSTWHPKPEPLFSAEEMARLKEGLASLTRQIDVMQHKPLLVEVTSTPPAVAGAIPLGAVALDGLSMGPVDSAERPAADYAVALRQEALGQLFYEVYCQHADWKNYQGLPCPRWDERATRGNPEAVLTDAVRGHWRAVAAFALGYGVRIPGAQAASR